MKKDLIIQKQEELIKFYEQKLSTGEVNSAFQIKSELSALINDKEEKLPWSTNALDYAKQFQSSPPQPKRGGEEEEKEMDKFHHILLKSGIKNRAFFTSNDFHTIWDAVKEYCIQSEEKDVFPIEFIEWIGKNEMFFETRYPNEPDHNRWMHEIKRGRIKYRTTKELFDYWKSNSK